MSYGSQFRGSPSPWLQQNSQQYVMDRYSQMYDAYDRNRRMAMLADYYGSSQGGYRSIYRSVPASSMRSMEYPSYSADRMSSYQDFYNRVQYKRIAQSIPAESPVSKWPRLENGLRRENFRDNRTQRRRGRDSRRGKRSATKPSGTKQDGYDSWKSSDDENETSGKGKKSQPANKTEGAKVQTDKTKDIKESLVCQVCKVKCSSLENFGNHMTSRTHKLKVNALLRLQRERNRVTEASKIAPQRVEGWDRAKRGKRRRQWCKLCKCSFSESFLTHRRTRDHRKNYDEKHPRCRPCETAFKNAEDYKEHCKEETHKMKSAVFNYAKSLPFGSDNDAAAIEPMKEQAPVSGVTSSEESGTVTEETKEKETKEKETKEKEIKEKETKEKETKPYGEAFVASAKGYYCKLCSMFFKNATNAKVIHCSSVIHNEAFKKAMKEALEQEAAKQKLEQEKEEAKAADNAQTAASAEKIEQVSEKKDQEEVKDAGSEKSPETNGDTVNEKMEVCDDGNIAKSSGVETTGEEIKGVEKNTGGSEQLPSPAHVAAAAAGENSGETDKTDNKGDGQNKGEPTTYGRRRGRGRRGRH